jgi:phosphoadenosine phosphosulfate reductase
MDRFSVGAKLAMLGLNKGGQQANNETLSRSEPMWLDGSTPVSSAEAEEQPKSILKRPSAEQALKPSGARVSFGPTTFSDQVHKSNPESMSATELLQCMCSKHSEGIVVSTNFGPNSAVILHLVTRVYPNIPVVWVDTGYLSKETYIHAEQLSKLLNLNLHVFQPSMSRARMEAIYGNLWETDEKEFGRLRKVEPMKRALNELNVKASIVGLRRSQLGNSARSVSRISKDGNERYRVLPIFDWTDADMLQYIKDYGLPLHGDVTSGPRRDALRYAEHGINAISLVAEEAPKKSVRAAPSIPLKINETPLSMGKIQELPDVEVYTKVNSSLCKSTRKLLEEKGTAFTEYIVDIDIAEDTLLASIGGGQKSAPFVFIGGQYVGGFNEICERLGEDPRRHVAVWGRNVANIQVGLV